MTQDNERLGEVFSRTYLVRGNTPLQDSQYFRNRLASYFESFDRGYRLKLAAALRREGGYDIDGAAIGSFFRSGAIEDVLDAVTLIWRCFDEIGAHPLRDRWRGFVARAMREQNMAYKLDGRCGVRYVVDEEFERNIASTLACLERPRYAGVRAAFEDAHRFIQSPPADPKSSVRSSFEAVEILARLIDPDSRNLNKFQVLNKLKPHAVGKGADDVEKAVVGKAFDGFAELIDGLHNYRHGQGIEEAVAPTLTLAVYVLSSCAAMLRWLVEIDLSLRQTGS